MAIDSAYASVAEYLSASGKEDTSDNARIAADLISITRFIDLDLDQFFSKDADEELGVARDFYGSGDRLLYLNVPLAAAPLSVVADDSGNGTPETTWAATDYQLMPLNATKDPEPRPYTKLYIPDWSSKGIWSANTLYRITAQWGWPEIPAAIKAATIQLTAILRLETPRAQATVSELGQLVQMSPKAQGIVEDLRRHYQVVSL